MNVSPSAGWHDKVSTLDAWSESDMQSDCDIARGSVSVSYSFFSQCSCLCAQKFCFLEIHSKKAIMDVYEKLFLQHYLYNQNLGAIDVSKDRELGETVLTGP